MHCTFTVDDQGSPSQTTMSIGSDRFGLIDCGQGSKSKPNNRWGYHDLFAACDNSSRKVLYSIPNQPSHFLNYYNGYCISLQYFFQCSPAIWILKECAWRICGVLLYRHYCGIVPTAILRIITVDTSCVPGKFREA